MLTFDQLLAEVKEQEIEFDEVETHLHIRATMAAQGLIARYRFRKNITTFTSDYSGQLWYSIPVPSKSEDCLGIDACPYCGSNDTIPTDTRLELNDEPGPKWIVCVDVKCEHCRRISTVVMTPKALYAYDKDEQFVETPFPVSVEAGMQAIKAAKLDSDSYHS